jgi:hypothetical protein
VKTSHNKNRYQRENIGYDGLEYHKPKRCPLLRGTTNGKSRN